MANIATARIQDFTRINPLFFFGSKSDQDPQEFLNIVHNAINLMGVNSSDRAEFGAYQL